jgi:hypothetical protein
VTSERADNDEKQVAAPFAAEEASVSPPLPIPPREETTKPVVGRWKVDPTMAPVGSNVSREEIVAAPPPPEPPAAPPIAGRAAKTITSGEEVVVPTRIDRRMRGMGKPLAILGAVLLLLNGAAYAFYLYQQTAEEEKQQELAAAEALKPAPAPLPAAPPPPPPKTSRLITAIRQAKHEEVKELLDKKANPNEEVLGTTPLATAIFWGDTKSIKLLLDAGANVNGTMSTGDMPLFVAARRGQTDVVTMLLDAGADLTAADKQGGTPLMHSLDGGRSDVVKLLLDKGADPLARRTDGQTAVTIALGKNQLENYRILDAATAASARPMGEFAPKPWRFLSELTATEPAKTATAPAAMPKVMSLESPHGLWLAPPEDRQPGRAVYKLDRGYRFFQGFVAVADTAFMKGNQSVTFRIVGDGKELWKSDELQRAGDFRGFRVEVAEVVSLELFVECKAEAAGADAIWVEPKLVN